MALDHDEFERGYCERSGISVEQMRQWNHVVPCDCGDEICEGWAMVPLDWVNHRGLIRREVACTESNGTQETRNGPSAPESADGPYSEPQ